MNAPSLPGISRTAFFGRDAERAALRDLLLHDETQLVTVLGQGGIGKTRLVHELAQALATHDAVDVVWTDATSATEGIALLDALAAALDLDEADDVARATAMQQALRDRSPLVILDNLEQIPDAGQVVATLLREIPALTILATSRVPLNLQAERRFPLTTLLDRTASLPEGAALREHPAAQLFIDRARRVRPGWTPSDRELATIGAICQRVEGVPLAIELAAARSALLPPERLLRKLDQSFAILANGPADLPARHQTMQATIRWSLDLLAPDAHDVLRALSLFEEHIGDEAIEAVLDADAFTQLTTLVEHHLVQTTTLPTGDLRFHLSPIVREVLQPEVPEDLRTTIRPRIDAHAITLSAQIGDGLQGSEQAIWVAQGEADYPHLRLVLTRLIAQGEAAAAQEMAEHLATWWRVTGRIAEGKRLLDQVLALDGAPSGIRAKTLNASGVMCAIHGDYVAAMSAFDEAIALRRAEGDLAAVASGLNNLANVAKRQGDILRARAALREALQLYTQLGDPRRSIVLMGLAALAEWTGEIDEGIALLEQALVLVRAQQHARHEVACLVNLGVLHAERDPGRAREHLLAARSLAEEIAAIHLRNDSLSLLAELDMRAGRLAAAEVAYRELQQIARETDDRANEIEAQWGIARCCTLRGDPAQALPLIRELLTALATAEFPEELVIRALELTATVLHAHDRNEIALVFLAQATTRRTRAAYRAMPPSLDLATLRAHVSTAQADLAQTLAETASLAILVDLAQTLRLPETSPAATPPASSASTDHGLTRRELDVLRLVATGKTNAEIGDALFISPFTAKTHVANLLGKLDVESRAAAASWAARHGVLDVVIVSDDAPSGSRPRRRTARPS